MMFRYSIGCAFFAVVILFCHRVTECAEMSIGGTEYIKYDLLGTNTSIFGTSDTLSLRFKSIDPHGLLFYAHGTARHYMTLELYHCKLRFTVNMAEQFSYIFGDRLCDNEWHSVHITRDKHKLTIHLDKQPTKIIKIKMSKQFQTQYKLRINVRIYVGGTWKTANEIGVPIVKNFIGCLEDVLFHSFHLITNARRKKLGYTTPGVISYTCPTTKYKPLSFLNEMAYLKVRSPNQDKVSVSFKFRTYEKNGILMHRDGPKITVYLYLENGKLKFEFYVPGKKPLTLDTDTFIDADFNDGEWHSVKASLDQKAMIFRVDNGSEINADAHTLMVSEPSSLDFENFTHIGGGTYYKGMYGFAGCMMDLLVDDVELDLDKLPKETTSVSVQIGKCTTRSFCHPSPCQYGSRCEQHSNNFTCICKKFYEGRFCEIPLFQSTCQGYKELGMKEDSYCRLDPDGKGPMKEFRVLCNMTHGKDAVTIVNHTKSDRQVKVRGEAYRYSPSVRSWLHLMKYGIDSKSIRALIEESDHCRQYVEFNCINTKFLSPRSGDFPGAYWFSVDGVERYYWGGAKLGGTTCACGTTLSCHDKNKWCNCDTGDGVWRQDVGYLTFKDDLPVAGVYFPTSAKDSNFTIGPLECFGRKQTLTRETEERTFFDIACQSLVTKPPPVFPWQQKKLTTTLKPKLSSVQATTLRATTKSSASTSTRVSSSSGTKGWLVVVNASNATGITGNGKNNATSLPTTTAITVTTLTATTSNSSGHIVTNEQRNDKEYTTHGWWLILIIIASSLLTIIAFIFLFLMLRHKRKNGVWCKGLFMFMAGHQQLPKIEIYRHSIGVDSPDILHMEDFKNTKVVDVHFHRGHFARKKSSAKKKTVTFKDRC